MNKLLIPFLLLACACQGQEFERFKAYNGIEYEYTIIFPTNYSASEDYELAMVFTEVEKLDNICLETISALSGKAFTNTLFVIPKVPLGKPHWKSHPIHHALNALMVEVRKEYGKKDQKFHFIGYKGGSNTAQTYTSMSSDYVASLSIIQSTYWPRNEQEWFDQVTKRKTPVFIYESIEKDEIEMDLSKTTFSVETDWLKAFQRIDERLGKRS